MTNECIYSVLKYLNILYKCNQKLIKLNGADAIRHMSESEELVLYILDNIPRIIPYKTIKETLKIGKKDGLVEFGDQIPYLRSEYENILSDNYDTLKHIKKLRNKYEHKVHAIKPLSASSGSNTSYEFEFSIENDNSTDSIKINCNSLNKLFKDLNILYSRIVYDIGREALKNSCANTVYGNKLIHFDFKDFNEIYESDLCKKIGRVLFDF